MIQKINFKCNKENVIKWHKYQHAKEGIRGNTVLKLHLLTGNAKENQKVVFVQKKECLEAGTKAKAEYDSGGNITDCGNISYSDFLNEWFEHEKPALKISTQSSYTTAINKSKEMIGHYKLSGITPRTLNNMFSELRQQGYATSYIRFIRRVINASLSYAYDMQLIKDNPCLRVKVKSTEVDKYKQPKTITKGEFETIIDSISYQCKYFRIPFYIGWYTGLRIGETLALTWNDIDFDNKMINVTKTEGIAFGEIRTFTPKTPTAVRSVLIGDKLIKILKEWQAFQINQADKLKTVPPDKVCTRNSLVPIKDPNLKQQCKKLSEQTGIPFSFHVLRHTHATILIQNNVNIKEVQTRLGHKNIQTTLDIYTHLQPSDTINSVNVFENL